MLSHFILTRTLQGIVHFPKEETSSEKFTTFVKITQLASMWNFKPPTLFPSPWLRVSCQDFFILLKPNHRPVYTTTSPVLCPPVWWRKCASGYHVDSGSHNFSWTLLYGLSSLNSCISSWAFSTGSCPSSFSTPALLHEKSLLQPSHASLSHSISLLPFTWKLFEGIVCTAKYSIYFLTSHSSDPIQSAFCLYFITKAAPAWVTNGLHASVHPWMCMFYLFLKNCSS